MWLYNITTMRIYNISTMCKYNITTMCIYNCYLQLPNMKNSILIILLLSLNFSACSQKENPRTINKKEIKEDLNKILTDIKDNYIYLNEKDVDLNCIKEKYTEKIDLIKSEEEIVLFFEYLLDEFYDSHITLNTNRKSSFRLNSPIHSKTENGKTIITHVWQNQIENLTENIIGAEILKFNTKNFDKVIDQFSTTCNNKTNKKVRNWIANKILSGRYNEPRNLELKLVSGKTIKLNIDSLEIKKHNSLLSIKKVDDIGIITINNSLGNNLLITEFDQALNSLINSKGIIIDLRNTVSGGNSYVARGIMSRFIEKDQPYQKHQIFDESWNNQPKVKRSWVEYVSPRGKQYKKPVVILVGKWTGSMGEGLAIGFEGMERAEIVGTEMEQLAGAIYNFSFKNQKFGFQLSTEKLYHINGTPREKYIPTNYVNQTKINEDEIMKKGIEIINKSR